MVWASLIRIRLPSTGSCLPPHDPAAQPSGLAVQLLAELKTYEPAHLYLLAELAGVLADKVVDRAVWVAHPGLLHQTDLAIELLELALDDLVDHRFGLAGRLRGVDLALLLNHFGWEVLAPNAARIGRRDLHREFTQQSLKFRRFGNEVGFAVELEQHAELAAGMDVRADRAFRGDPAGALRCRGDTLLTKPYDCLFQVAIGLGQRLLAVHYTGAGLVAQFPYQVSVDFHRFP